MQAQGCFGMEGERYREAAALNRYTSVSDTHGLSVTNRANAGELPPEGLSLFLTHLGSGG